MKSGKVLPDSVFVVLSLIAEAKVHGYEIQKKVHNRGFQFWTNLKKSSVYNALIFLEKEKLVKPEILSGDGPDRKVFAITEKGKDRLVLESAKHLSNPSHPKSEIDLGIYTLPFLNKGAIKSALDKCILNLEGRYEFLRERFDWCAERNLDMPALAFERPMLLLEVEIKWLKKVKAELEKNKKLRVEDWQKYVYLQPPDTTEED